jgi:hypothetical protein
LRDQVVENHVHPPCRGPSARIIAETVQKVEDRIKLLCGGIVTGRGVDVEIAVVAHHAGFVEVPVDRAVRHVIGFPGKGSRPAHVYDTLGIEQVGLHQRIEWIDQADAVGHEHVTVKVRLQRAGGNAPDAPLVFLHGRPLDALAGEQNLFGVGSAEPERHAVVRVYLRRLERLSLLGQTRKDGSRERNHRSTFDGDRSFHSDSPVG